MKNKSIFTILFLAVFLLTACSHNSNKIVEKIVTELLLLLILMVVKLEPMAKILQFYRKMEFRLYT